MILLATIVVFGSIVGIVTLRDHIVQEYGDMAVAISSLNQSWRAPSISTGYTDRAPTAWETDPMNDEPAGLNVQVAPLAEGSPLP